MLNKKACLVALAVLFLFTVPFATAVPPLPAAYFGNITVNGEPAPAGTTIIAKIDGVERGRITTTISGMYGEDFYERLIVEGGENEDIVRFHVEEVEAKESVTWVSGCDPTQVDLTFVGVPTPTPTPTPTPSNGRDGGGYVPTTPTPTEKPPAVGKVEVAATPSPTLAPTITPSAAPTQTPTPTSTPAPVPRLPPLFLILIVIAVVVIAGIIIMVLRR